MEKVNGHANMLQHARGALGGFLFVHVHMNKSRLSHLIANAHNGIERVHGGLGNHRNPFPANLPAEILVIQGHDVLVVQPDLALIGPRIARKKTQDRFGQRTLATTGLADDDRGFVLAQVKIDAVYSLDEAISRIEIQAKVSHLQD